MWEIQTEYKFSIGSKSFILFNSTNLVLALVLLISHGAECVVSTLSDSVCLSHSFTGCGYLQREG